MENKKENKKGKVTLDKLARMVADGFSELSDKVATKGDIVRVEDRLAKVEYQVDENNDILKRFEENDVLNLQKRVQILEKAVRTLANQISK